MVKGLMTIPVMGVSLEPKSKAPTVIPVILAMCMLNGISP